MKLAWKPILVAFVIGAAIGGIGAWWSTPDYFHKYWGRDQFSEHLLQRFNTQLRLTPEQRTQVAAILETKRQKIDALRAEMRPKFEEIRTSASAEIRQLLNPTQQQRFDQLEAEWKARWERHHAHRK